MTGAFAARRGHGCERHSEKRGAGFRDDDGIEAEGALLAVDRAYCRDLAEVVKRAIRTATDT